MTKPAQMVQRAVVFVKSGAIYQPRNVILGLTMIGGMVLGGVGACKYRKKSAQVVTITREYEECRDQAGFLAERGSRDFREWDIAALAYSITGSQALGTALDQDRAFADLVETVSSILADPGAYDWLWNPSTAAPRNLRTGGNGSSKPTIWTTTPGTCSSGWRPAAARAAPPGRPSGIRKAMTSADTVRCG